MLSAAIGFRGARLIPVLRGSRCFHVSQGNPAAKVAVVLSGCGVYDGTEIHEASAILVHLSRAGAEVQMFAPDMPQMHVVDHSRGQPSPESRNVLVESARLARGNITALSQLNVKEHDAVIFPGGFGAAKNLSSFAVDGESCRVQQDVERVLTEFSKAKKPIGWVVVGCYPPGLVPACAPRTPHHLLPVSACAVLPPCWPLRSFLAWR
ncbi:hypothetical protein XENTR_v10004638 [Xenopus tropicalis]|nr:hypothetical protein XENTR_v10004638 [Xenopus tropicalis]